MWVTKGFLSRAMILLPFLCIVLSMAVNEYSMNRGCQTQVHHTIPRQAATTKMPGKHNYLLLLSGLMKQQYLP